MSKFLTIKLRANHDRNGNPRRCFVTFNTNTRTPVAVYDEEYSGDAAVTNRYHQQAISGIVIDVSPEEYRAWLMVGKGLSK